MKSLTSVLFSLLALGLFANAQAELAGLKEGEQYIVVSAEASDEPVIYEFFNYACGACYQMEGFVNNLKKELPKETKFKYVPIELRPAWAIYVKAYYMAEMLNVLDSAHLKMFQRLHVNRKFMKGDDELKAFFVELGVSEADFDKVANHFQLKMKMNQSRQLARKFKVTGTPSFVINEKYKLENTKLSTEELKRALTQGPLTAK